jgi:hypothetical protein
MIRRALPFALLATGLACATPAGASQIYPEAIAAQLGSPCPPLCTLCHDTVAGGSATANRPFGIRVRTRPYSLVSGDTQQLSEVLTRLEADASDIDGDGTIDIAELRAGTDPNVAGSTPLECYTPPPAEDDGGCAIPRAAPGDGAAFAASALVAVWLLARRRRQPLA